MTRIRTAHALLAAAGLLALVPSAHAQFTSSVFATGANVSATGPDSITVGGGHVFIQYGNGASSNKPLGTGGASTIAEYDLSGNVLNTFSALGSADGVRYNPYTNLLWVLQNQDGNSALETIDPTTGATTHYAYTSPSANRGYDDANFTGGNAYLSYSNPGNSADPSTPVIFQATLGAGTVGLTSVLNAGGAGQLSKNTDVDSLNLTTGGGLLLTGGDDGTLTSVSGPGTAGQMSQTVALTDGKGNSLSGLDDALFALPGAQTLLVSDTKNNTVYAITGPFTPGAYYASVGSTNSVDSVNLATGVATSISDGLFAANSSPHGLAFLPAPVPEASTTVSLGLLLALGLGGVLVARKKRA